MSVRIDIPKDKIAEFCRLNRIHRLALFDSVLRDDFGSDSDVDVLVEFEPGHVPGLAFITIQDELSELLERNVDLNTPAYLSPYFRQEVLDEVEVLYVAARSNSECSPIKAFHRYNDYPPYLKQE